MVPLASQRIWSVAAFCVLLLPAVIVSCDRLPATRISSITENPRAYDGRVVTIAGEVTGSLNAVIVRGYQVKDDSGQLTVLCNGAVPKVGDRIRVRGRVEQAFAIGTVSAVVLHEEQR